MRQEEITYKGVSLEKIKMSKNKEAGGDLNRFLRKKKNQLRLGNRTSD